MRAFVSLFVCALTLSAKVNFYSREKEAALGEQIAVEESKNTTPLDSAATRVLHPHTWAGGSTRPCPVSRISKNV
jgi:hypothetical protein